MCDGAAHDDGLMADNESVEQTAAREQGRRRLVVFPDRDTFLIDHTGAAIYDVNRIIDGIGHAAECRGIVEGIAGIDEPDKIALGKTEGLVHGIVETVVGFADPSQSWIEGGIAADDGHCSVRRGAVHDEMFVVGACLTENAAERQFNPTGGVPGDGDDGDLHASASSSSFSNPSGSRKWSATSCRRSSGRFHHGWRRSRLRWSSVKR